MNIIKFASQSFMEIFVKVLLKDDQVDNKYSSNLTMNELDLKLSEYLIPVNETLLIIIPIVLSIEI